MNNYLLTTSKIDLPSIFQTDQYLFIKKIKKEKGKQSIVPICLPLSGLTEYIYHCQKVIDRILYFQKIKEKSFTNLNNMFVNLSGKNLDKLVGNHLKRLNTITILNDLGIIEINHNYSYRSETRLTKAFSKSYRIHPNYYSLSKEIKNTGEPQLWKIKDKDSIIGSCGSPVIKGNQDSIVGSCGSPVFDQIKRFSNLIGIDCDYNQITKSNKTGWIYSPITRLKKETRKLLVKDNGLIEVDIHAAHLQFFISLISDYYKDKTLPISINSELLSSELNRLSGWVMSGQVYERMMTLTGCVDRNCVKQVVMQWLASSGNVNKEVRCITSYYPEISNWIKLVNGSTRNTLLIELMKKEAELINSVFEKVINDHPDSVCLPIFDGVVVDKKICNQVYDLIIDNGSRMVGFNMIVNLK